MESLLEICTDLETSKIKNEQIVGIAEMWYLGYVTQLQHDIFALNYIRDEDHNESVNDVIAFGRLLLGDWKEASERYNLPTPTKLINLIVMLSSNILPSVKKEKLHHLFVKYKFRLFNYNTVLEAARNKIDCELVMYQLRKLRRDMASVLTYDEVDKYYKKAKSIIKLFC